MAYRLDDAGIELEVAGAASGDWAGRVGGGEGGQAEQEKKGERGEEQAGGGL